MGIRAERSLGDAIRRARAGDVAWWRAYLGPRDDPRERRQRLVSLVGGVAGFPIAIELHLPVEEAGVLDALASAAPGRHALRLVGNGAVGRGEVAIRFGPKPPGRPQAFSGG